WSSDVCSSDLGRVACHEGHAARVTAQIDRREVRVGGDEADLLGPTAERLGHDRHQHRVGSLADIDLATRHGHHAAAVEANINRGVGHVVPVQRQAGTAQVRSDGEADALAERQLAVAGVEPRLTGDNVDALPQAVAGNPQVVDGLRVGL